MEVVSATPDTATLPPSAFVAFVAASKAKAHGEKDGYCDGFWTTFGSFFLSIAFGSFFFEGVGRRFWWMEQDFL